MLTTGIFWVTYPLAILIIVKVTGISVGDLGTRDLSNAAVFSALKVLLAISTLELFLIPSIVFAYFSDRSLLPYIGFKKPVPLGFLLVAVIVIIGAFPIVGLLQEINQNIHLPKGMHETEKLIRDVEAKSDHFLRNFLRMKSGADLVIMLFIMAVLPAFAEEIFFRGVLQRLFIQMTRRPWAGIIITAIIFSAVHFQFLGFIPRMILGILLGALYWFSGSIWPGILAHFIYNAAQILLVYYNPQLADKDPAFPAGLVAGSAILVAGLTWWMQRISQTSYAEVYDTDDDFHIGPRDQYIA